MHKIGRTGRKNEHTKRNNKSTQTSLSLFLRFPIPLSQLQMHNPPDIPISALGSSDEHYLFVCFTEDVYGSTSFADVLIYPSLNFVRHSNTFMLQPQAIRRGKICMPSHTHKHARPMCHPLIYFHSIHPLRGLYINCSDGDFFF